MNRLLGLLLFLKRGIELFDRDSGHLSDQLGPGERARRIGEQSLHLLHEFQKLVIGHKADFRMGLIDGLHPLVDLRRGPLRVLEQRALGSPRGFPFEFLDDLSFLVLGQRLSCKRLLPEKALGLSSN